MTCQCFRLSTLRSLRLFNPYLALIAAKLNIQPVGVVHVVMALLVDRPGDFLCRLTSGMLTNCVPNVHS